MLSASLHPGAKRGIANRIVIAHFATQTDGEQYFEWRADINSGAELYCTRALVTRTVALAVAEELAALPDAVTEASRKPGRNSSSLRELHTHRGHNKDSRQRNNRLEVGRLRAIGWFGNKRKLQR